MRKLQSQPGRAADQELIRIKAPFSGPASRLPSPLYGKAMRYYFDVKGGFVPMARDNVGQDFDFASDAVAHAKTLAEGLRAHGMSIRSTARICVISEVGSSIHEERVFVETRKVD